ncbi:MAG: hypothetical protein ACP5RD_07930, partial [bacterium]
FFIEYYFIHYFLMKLKTSFYLKIFYLKIMISLFFLCFANFNLVIADNLTKSKIDSEILSLKSRKIRIFLF